MPDASGAAGAPNPSDPSEVSTTPMHLVLVDASGFVFRAFHALPPMSRPDGTPVNAVFGFTNMLARLMQAHECTHLGVVFDAGRTTHRNEYYPEYKAHRPEPPPELGPQFALVRDATAAFDVPGLEVEGWEADDVIASYAVAATAAGGRVTIISSDKDLMQLVTDRVIMHDPIKQKPIGPAEVAEKFGVLPGKVVEVQALMGDAVDNVPGVPGIGPKNAAQLIQEYGTVEAVLIAAKDMKPSKRRDALLEHAERARISRRLVELDCRVPLPMPLDGLRLRDPEPGKLATWLLSQGFRSSISRLGLGDIAARVQAEAPKPTPGGTAAGADAGAPGPDGGVEPVSASSSTPARGPQEPFGPYECVADEARLREWVVEARTAGVVAFDTETTSLDPTKADLVGVSIGVAPGRACYVPLRHQASGPVAAAAPAQGELGAEPAPPPPPPPDQITPDAAREILAPLLADSSVLKVFQNAKYDMLVLRRAGWPDPLPFDDTMLISYSMEAGAHGHGMDELSALHLGHTPISYDEVTGTGRGRIPFSRVPLDRATAYAAEDADVTLRLWQALRPRLRETASLVIYEQEERRLVPILAQMEREGVKVDEAELARLSADFGARMEAMERDIHALAGRSFQLGSNKQLGEILFDELKLPGGKRLSGGTWGTDASVLQSLADAGHALPARVLEWRQLAKLKSTYADALVSQVDPVTRRVHTNFSQAITSTGRLSSTDPNLQNIPIRTEEGGRIRRAFVAEPGCVLVSCDYSQIELRLMAHVADVPALKESFSKGEDIHARTASEVFGVPMDRMDPGIRRNAKTINFGIIYGISAFGLSARLGIEAGEARRYIDAYFARYPQIREYMDRAKAEAKAKGYVLTPFGRRCWVPQILDKRASFRAYAERAAINAPLQGGAADIIKRAMIRLPRALSDAGLRARMVLQVHDELLFEAPENEAARTAEVAREVMESAAHISVPLLVETGQGHSWAEAH